MKTGLKLAALLLAAILLIVGVIAGFRPVQDIPPPAKSRYSAAEASAMLNSLSLPDVTGKPFQFSAWKGKIRVFNFWATWCAPCREEMPALSALNNKFTHKNIQFAGISVDHADKVVEFTKTTPVSYPLLVADVEIMELTVPLGNPAKGLPFTVILDRNGKTGFAKLGRVSEAELERELDKLLRQ